MSGLKKKTEDYVKMTDNEKAEVKKIIKKVVKGYDFVDSAILFGSFVSRNYFGDVDIALMTGKKVNWDTISKMGIELEKITGLEIDIKLFEELPLRTLQN